MTRLVPVQVTAELEAYLESLIPEREPVLARLEQELEADNVPAIGVQVGNLLRLLLRMVGAGSALELGTAAGYSGIWLLGGLDQGRLVTLETDPKRAERARRNFAEAGFEKQAEVREEDALAYLERPGESFDCVFNDLLNSFPSEAVVERCFELSLSRLRPGGLLIADNALRQGEVVRPAGRQARNVAHYNRLVAGSPQLDSVVIPMRDGVSLALLRK